ncbi:MAG: ATP-dependent Lon protease [Planctomycetota bacterium]|jgi:ATP-dependent Lon protease
MSSLPQSDPPLGGTPLGGASAPTPRRREVDWQISAQEREVDRLTGMIETGSLAEAAEAAAWSELDHFRRAPRGSMESARSHTWLEWMLGLPWHQTRRRGTDKERFRRVIEALRQSHVGLEDVKQRIAEYLAVRVLGGGRVGGTVLCFVGPPGSGKSSMGEAIARALGRPCVTLPVGAFTEEGELAGRPHRTDSGSPGAILAGLHRTGVDDPVVLLDEVDKLRLGGEGTSAGALLQLLDPEKNARFMDRYLGTAFDLSRCLFLATANDALDLPEALLDRMETIEFPGYCEAEKLVIARRHLIPRARKHAAVSAKQFKITPAALESLIRGYTEEAGVRDLSRRLTALARKAALSVVEGGPGLGVKKIDLMPLLGPRTADEQLRLRRPVVGVAMGLAWTNVGGALLPVESIAVPGSGRLILTGQLGEVLRESAQTALTLVRSRLQDLELDPGSLDNLDLHLHFPGASTPKDGPSAGVAIVAALCSLLSQIPVRHDLAMTGEVSLLGQVLPVGGVREKLLAAVRSGIPEVAVPRSNAEDTMRLPADTRRQLTIHLVSDIYELLDLALCRDPDRAKIGASTSRRNSSAARARRR